MTRSFVLAFAAAASFACSRPAPAVSHAQLVPEPGVHIAAAPVQPAPSGTPTPQPAEPPHVAVAPSAVAVAAPAAPAQAAPSGGNSRHFGAAIENNVQNVRLAQILNAPQQFNGQQMRVEGQVVAVCQHMGCWMEIRDEHTQAHVRMHGHSFFLPRDVNGHRATVEATLVAAHPATECDQAAHAATGQVAQLELDALGVDVYN